MTVHLDQGDVGVRVGADDPGPKTSTVRELDHDAIRPVDDVVVGQNAAIGIDDEACAGPSAGILAARGTLRISELVGRRRYFRTAALPGGARASRGGFDVDDSWIDTFDDVGKVDEGSRGGGARRTTGRRLGRFGFDGSDRGATDTAREDNPHEHPDDCRKGDGDEGEAT